MRAVPYNKRALWDRRRSRWYSWSSLQNGPRRSLTDQPVSNRSSVRRSIPITHITRGEPEMASEAVVRQQLLGQARGHLSVRLRLPAFAAEFAQRRSADGGMTAAGKRCEADDDGLARYCRSRIRFLHGPASGPGRKSPKWFSSPSRSSCTTRLNPTAGTSQE